VLELIRSLPGGDKIPVIAVTGFAQANDRDKFIALGFDSYIPKPISTATFVSEVNEVIELKLS
jgi:two-component system cell cycle response regulator DivK